MESQVKWIEGKWRSDGRSQIVILNHLFIYIFEWCFIFKWFFILEWCSKQTCQISDLDFPAAARKVPCLTGAESQATKHLIIINLLIDANANEIQTLQDPLGHNTAMHWCIDPLDLTCVIDPWS